MFSSIDRGSSTLAYENEESLCLFTILPPGAKQCKTRSKKKHKRWKERSATEQWTWHKKETYVCFLVVSKNQRLLCFSDFLFNAPYFLHECASGCLGAAFKDACPNLWVVCLVAYKVFAKNTYTTTPEAFELCIDFCECDFMCSMLFKILSI